MSFDIDLKFRVINLNSHLSHLIAHTKIRYN